MVQTSHILSAYAVLRQGGASPDRAQVELAIPQGRGRQLEAIFRVRRPGKGDARAHPRFARHDAHVRAVLGAGGFPVLRR